MWKPRGQLLECRGFSRNREAEMGRRPGEAGGRYATISLELRHAFLRPEQGSWDSKVDSLIGPGQLRLRGSPSCVVIRWGSAAWSRLCCLHPVQGWVLIWVECSEILFQFLQNRSHIKPLRSSTKEHFFFCICHLMIFKFRHLGQKEELVDVCFVL